jgi:tetratricopeptide (TPR) repeat protein
MDRYHQIEGSPLETAVLGRYQIHARIGRGTMGVVYRARDPVLAREIALKTVEVSPALGEAERERFLARFLQEARIAAKLLHPGIVVTHDASIDERTSVPFIAMELVTGGSLADRLERAGPLGWQDAARLVSSLARALDYAHREGVVHRDVKPANVLLTPEGVPKIADFGIAKLEDAHLTESGAVLGTPYYMSPEQIEAKEIDGRSDLFSLGSLLHALLAGRPPFTGPDLPAITRQILFKDPDPPSGIPPALAGVLARALAKEPGERYQSGADFADDLERVIRGESPRRPLALGEKTIEAVKRAPERGRSRLPALAALLLAGLGGYAAYAHWEDAARLVRENREEAMRREGLRADAEGSRARAREALVRGLWDEASRDVEASLALSRDGSDGAGEAEALLLRGLLRADIGQWSEARADLESAAAVFEIYGVAEGRSRARAELASLERDLGELDRAEALYRGLDGPEAAIGNAMLDWVRGDALAAEGKLRTVHEGGGMGKSKAALYLGLFAATRGEMDDAERLWRDAAEDAESQDVELLRGVAAIDVTGERVEKLQAIFLGEPRTKRSDERAKRLPEAISPPGS